MRMQSVILADQRWIGGVIAVNISTVLVLPSESMKPEAANRPMILLFDSSDARREPPRRSTRTDPSQRRASMGGQSILASRILEAE